MPCQKCVIAYVASQCCGVMPRSAFSLRYGYDKRIFREPAPELARFFTRRFFRIAPLFYVMTAAWAVVIGRHRSRIY
jgi:peptidoglycan/LPS O-acetylase OafA/YrhL